MTTTTACLNPGLDLFERRPIDISILRTEEVSLKPLAALNASSQLEFLSLGKTDCYRDLSSIYLRLRVKLLKDAILNVNHTDSKIGVVNNLIHSMFKQISVFLNNKPVGAVDTNYPYRAYFESLLNFGEEQARIHLEPSGWQIDSGVIHSIEAGKNIGLDKRKEMFGKSGEVELISRLHCDMFNQHKYLINGVDLRVILTLESPNFYVMAEDTDTSSIKILDATLYVPHLTVNPQILLAHHQILQKGRNVVYPYQRVEVKSYSISPGGQTMSIDNVILGNLPNLLLFAMTDHRGYSGKRSLNPFNLTHNDIQSFCLRVNGIQHPANPVEFDFTDPENPISSRGFELLIKETQIFERAHQIHRKTFNKGFFMLATDLTAGHSYNNGNCHNPLRQSTVSIEAKFAKALSSTITVLVYAEYDAMIEIDKDRNVYTSF